VGELIDRWRELRAQGQDISAEELCGDRPDLLDRLRHDLRALDAMEAFLGPGTGEADPQAAPSVDEAATIPPGPEASLDAAAAPGPVVPGYEVLGELGRGGMGVVYRARHLKLNRVVALKMVLAGGHAGPDDLTRFLGEAEAVAALQHPHIVQLYEFGQHDGLPFFTLEFVPGGSLTDKLSETTLTPKEAARLVEQLAHGVHYAHGKGIVHRDLKPGNVLLAEDGTPKVTDFGLAKRLEVGTGLTASGAIMGTPTYMAPEQAGGHGKRVGPLADVYALGAILYECLTGRPPFKAATALDTILQVVSEEPASVRQLQPGAPADLETICHRCLQKEPGKRYASAEELAEDLRRFQAGEPIRARPVSAWERTWKWVRRRPAEAGLVGAVVLVVLVGLAGAGVYVRYKDQQATALAQQLERRHRLDDLRAEGEKAEDAGQLTAAKESWDRALATLDADPGAATEGLRHQIEERRDRVVRRLEDLAARQDLRDRINRFEEDRNDVLFHELSFSERDRGADRAAIRRAAPAALARFGLTADDRPEVAGRRLEASRHHAAAPEQVDRVAAECYQLLLVWAEAESGAEDHAAAARRALHLLDLAAALGQAHHLATPRAFHVRTARYLTQAGDAAAARAERALADRAREATALDQFLAALDSYRHGQPAQAAAACEEVLRQEPEHFWAQYLQALCQLRTGRWGEAKAGLTACLGRRPAFVWARHLRAAAHGQLGSAKRLPSGRALPVGRAASASR
jgi:hypothetical protein